MLHKGDVALRVALLLIPRHAPSVRVQRGHDVVQAVAVHVVDSHHCAAAIRAKAAKGFRMVFPRLIASRRRLLPPAVHIQDVHASVAVHIADAEAMSGAVALL